MSIDTEEKEQQKKLCALQPDEVLSSLGTGWDGLTKDAAVERLNQYGPNTLTKVKGKPLIVRFLSNFAHLMAILLWIAGIIALFAKMPQLAIAVWMVNIINGIFSFFQEFRAEKATEALKKMLPAYAHVLRGGEELRILADELVPGDIIILAEGDSISADARLIEENDLKTDQATLTGESRPVSKTKDAVLRDDLAHTEMPNLVFAGTNVASGTGKAVIFATGMKTQFGKIAGLTQNIKEDTSPLQKEMGRLTKKLSLIAVSIGALFFVLSSVFAKNNIVEDFIFALGMIVAFIPEGLLPTVTLSLAMGVQRMAKRNALIKKLSAVETLGCTTVICTDKTGTLTQNEMTVGYLWTLHRPYTAEGAGYAPQGNITADGKTVNKDNDGDLYRLLKVFGLCNNARLIPPEGESPRWNVLGDPTEAALLVAAGKGGVDLAAELSVSPRLRELPFDSRRKRMSTIHQINDKELGTFHAALVKGAPKEVLDLCTSAYVGGKLVTLTEDMRKSVIDANDDCARKGLRVLAAAFRNLDNVSLPESLSEYTPENVETDMVFLGLAAMADPARPEVSAAVEKCNRAGIRIIMITGDYGLTAESIARKIGIIKGDHPRVFTGVELSQISDDELKAALKGEVIFARVAPEQKLRVVSALQEMGEIVAVTGDGVNDSPALKKADIGVAMGITGTDVAKEAADMILTDDNFASIVNAVEEGRAVYTNIRRFSTYILNSNVPEAIPAMLSVFSRGAVPLPLTLMQILSIDLGTDMVPAIGLGAELPEDGSMDRPPRPIKEPLLNKKLLLRGMVWYGLLESAAAVISFFFLNLIKGWRFGQPMPGEGSAIYMEATMMTLAAIVFCQIGVVFNCRTDIASVFKIGFFRNHIVLIGVLSEIVLLCALSYLPFLHEMFNTAALGPVEWVYLLIWPVFMVLLDEIRKMILRRRIKAKRNPVI